MKNEKLEARIRYEEDWNGMGEHFVYELKRADEDEWGLDSAFKLIDDRLSYQALTKIREYMRLGIDFHFSR